MLMELYERLLFLYTHIALSIIQVILTSRDTKFSVPNRCLRKSPNTIDWDFNSSPFGSTHLIQVSRSSTTQLVNLLYASKAHSSCASSLSLGFCLQKFGNLHLYIKELRCASIDTYALTLIQFAFTIVSRHALLHAGLCKFIEHICHEVHLLLCSSDFFCR